MIKQLSDEVIEKILLEQGFLVDYAENLKEWELNWWKAIAQAQYDQDCEDTFEYLKSRWNGTEFEGCKIVSIPDKDWQELQSKAGE